MATARMSVRQPVQAQPSWVHTSSPTVAPLCCHLTWPSKVVRQSPVSRIRSLVQWPRAAFMSARSPNLQYEICWGSPIGLHSSAWVAPANGGCVFEQLARYAGGTMASRSGGAAGGRGGGRGEGDDGGARHRRQQDLGDALVGAGRGRQRGGMLVRAAPEQAGSGNQMS